MRSAASARHPHGRRLRRALGALALLALAALGLVALLAPQVLVLAREGFPGPVWPVPGSFALVPGVAVPADPPPGTAPPPDALLRLREGGGRALLAERGGALIAEAYGEGIARDTRLNSFSLVKSLIGALVLRAVADGRIASLDASLRDILGPGAPPVTVGEALAMRSGLALAPDPPKTEAQSLDDAGFSPFGPLARLHAFGIEAVTADLRVDGSARGTFRYQSANTALLGLALERTYGRPLPDILSEAIWRPAGAADAHWRRVPGTGDVSAYCCLYARPLDWLRVGRFLLANGTPEAPFLPEALWRALILPDLEPAERRAGAYGAHIRHDVLDRPGAGVEGPFAFMHGHGGQVVYLLPSPDAVAVRFGERPQLLHSTLYELLAPPDGPLPRPDDGGGARPPSGASSSRTAVGPWP